MSWLGMNASAGERIEGLEHIAQSIRDVLTTPIGSRLMRRDYGSNIPDLIDQPTNGATLMRLSAATVIALRRWEPRVRITRINWIIGSAGQLTADMRLILAEQSAEQTITLTLGAR